VAEGTQKGMTWGYGRPTFPYLAAQTMSKEHHAEFTGSGAISLCNDRVDDESFHLLPSKAIRVVKDPTTQDTIDWGTAFIKPMESEVFARFYSSAVEHLYRQQMHVIDSSIGADAEHAVALRFLTNSPSLAAFARTMFRDPTKDAIESWSMVHVPDYPIPHPPNGTEGRGIFIDFTKKQVLIAGLWRMGWVREAIGCVLGFYLPTMNMIPLHSSVVVDNDGRHPMALVGGPLSGKTTLAMSLTDVMLVGDDLHGVSERGIFNIEAGLYASIFRADRSPSIGFRAAISFGTILENARLDWSGEIDWDATSEMVDPRAVIPMNHLTNRAEAVVFSPNMRGGKPATFFDPPENIVFLVADATGTMPAMASLTPEQAIDYFSLGPFCKWMGDGELIFTKAFTGNKFPRPMHQYAEIFASIVERTGAKLWMVNTGWQGGTMDNGGERIPHRKTIGIIEKIMRGDFNRTDWIRLEPFGLSVPNELSYDPSHFWDDEERYRRKAEALYAKLVDKFPNAQEASM
jgi:phosphoenolpyruvate carboxykinase (ATP)